MENDKKYQDQRYNVLTLYNKINSVFSPALQAKITFPSESFNHIIFKNARTERERPSQILRFKLLPLAAKLVELSTTYQEYEELSSEVVVKRHKKRIKENRIIKYWGIITILEGQKIKVILRKIGDNGLAHFWSIIPAWTTNKYRDTKFYTTMKGCPEED